MEFKVKIGDKCKIPKTKQGSSSFHSSVINLTKQKGQDFLYYNGINEDGIHLLNEYYTPTRLTGDFFAEHEIELYEEKQETMKNLLETEFVIENCTLSQRLAIKAYCDEKKIKYWSENTFTNEQAPCIHWDLEEFLCGITGGNKNVITFSELIQFLDKYQPEPEFKVGDHIKLLKVVDGRKVGDIVCITSIQADDSYNNMKDVSVKAKGWINYNANNLDKGGFRWGGNGYYSGDHFRHATPEEIKKWKEENEIKLPKIGSYSGEHSTTKLKWGCTTISIATIKELLSLSLQGITLNGYVLDNEKVQQIKKFIEHNKL